ncbi:hypothetical protein GCM10027443_28970 [Pontibacter brevis]
MLFHVGNKYKVKALLHYRESDVTGNAFNYDYLIINTSVLTVAALGYAPLPSQLFRLGSGPAYNRAKGTVLYGDTEREKKNVSKLGVVVESGVSFPKNARFFADLQVQYFYTVPNRI